MVDAVQSQAQDTFEAHEALETPLTIRPNQRDLVALYARRLELSSPNKAAHPSWPEKMPQPDLDEWAAVELVQLGRPMVAEIVAASDESVESIPEIAIVPAREFVFLAPSDLVVSESVQWLIKMVSTVLPLAHSMLELARKVIDRWRSKFIHTSRARQEEPTATQVVESTATMTVIEKLPT
jgi:hypothetical protein